MLNEKDSKTLAMALLYSTSSEEVIDVLKDQKYKSYFSNAANWAPYGGRDKNWDAAGNQQSNGVGALVENVVNGLDAILLKKAEESGITDHRASSSPQSMQEAVKRFFNIPEGRLSNLDDGQKREIAKHTVKIGVSRERKNTLYPTYTIVDEGIGQRPEDFPKTFVSLSEKNKEGIKYVQGKFNQGSTGVLRYCTKGDMRLGHHKLIISKRFDGDSWGWTLVRVREPNQGESLPVVEYFMPGKIMHFASNDIAPFKEHDVVKINSGSIVKLYEVDISRPFNNVGLGIYQALATSLIQPPLPIQIFDFGATPVEGKGELRKKGIDERICSGLIEMLCKVRKSSEISEVDEVDEDVEIIQSIEPLHLHIATLDEPELGTINITATCRESLQKFISSQPKRVFYTINGQVHATERASWLNTSCNLGGIQDNVIVNVDCTELTNSAVSQLFMTDRERMVENRLSVKLRDLVKQQLKDDPQLREFMHRINLMRAQKHIEDKSEVKDLIQGMVKSDPSLKELFGLGAEIEAMVEHPKGDTPFKGEKFPTFLAPINAKDSDGKFEFIVPRGSLRKLRCNTDAANDYLSRSVSAGSRVFNFTENQCQISVSLKDGIATFSFSVEKEVEVGAKIVGNFGFTDVSRPEPLTFQLTIMVAEAEQSKEAKPGERKPGTKKAPDEGIKMPDIQWVKEESFSQYNFDEDSAVTVRTSDQGITVHVNWDHKALKVMRQKEKDDSKILIKENIFKYGLAIISIAIFKKEQDENPDNAVETLERSSKAIAPYFVPLVKYLANLEI
jgi:hypothetical protein